MPKIQYSFRLSSNLKERINNECYITLPVKHDYAKGFKDSLITRSHIILDHISLKSLHLNQGTSNHFDASVRRYLEVIQEIQPEISFIPVFCSTKHSVDKNIEITKEIHSWFAEKYDIDSLAGMILGDEPDEWIEWIKLCWGRNSWGILTSNNLKAVEMLMSEASELKHVHLFETNWLLNQERLRKFDPLTINQVTFDGSVYALLKATKQTIKYEHPNLVIRQGSLTVEDFIETIEKFLRA